MWDTAGQERFRKSMVEHYYRNVHAVVFVYDVTKMTSFTNLKMWIEECNGHAVSPLVPKVLVGNKCDLKDLIQVPSSMALKFADAHNMLLFETSAKDPKESQNVESIFMCLACRLKAQKSLLYRDVEKRPGWERRTGSGEARDGAERDDAGAGGTWSRSEAQPDPVPLRNFLPVPVTALGTGRARDERSQWQRRPEGAGTGRSGAGGAEGSGRRHGHAGFRVL